MNPRLPAPEDWVIFIALLAVATLALGALYYLWRRRNSAAEKERLRRLSVNRIGRITDGTVTDVSLGEASNGQPAECLVQYHYWIGGVEYSTSQDISALLDVLGRDPARLVGSVTVKYHSQNPFNSIILCEQWSGLRESVKAPLQDMVGQQRE